MTLLQDWEPATRVVERNTNAECINKFNVLSYGWPAVRGLEGGGMPWYGAKAACAKHGMEGNEHHRLLQKTIRSDGKGSARAMILCVAHQNHEKPDAA